MKKIFSFLFFGMSAFLHAQAPCDGPDCCSIRCGDREACLCDCFFANGQALRQQEKYAEAVAQFQAVQSICPDRQAQAVIDSIYSEHRIWVYQAGKFAIATPLGEPITPFQFSNPEPFRKGVAIFSEEDNYFFVDKDGKVLTPMPGYDGIIPTEGGMYYLKKGNQNSIATEMPSHPAYWRNNNKLLSLTAEELSLWDDIDSMRLFFNRTHKYTYIKPFQLNVAWANIGGKFASLGWNNDVNLEGGRWGLIDKSGAEVIAPKYEAVKDFSEEIAWVKEEEGQWGVVNRKGDVIVIPKYEDAKNFNEGLSWVKEEGKWGVINRKGDVIVIPKYEDAKNFNEELSCVKEEGKWGVINGKGDVVVIPKYENVTDFNEGIAWAQKEGTWWLINDKGQEIFSPKFEINYWFLPVFKEGRARIRENDKYGFVDKYKYGFVDKYKYGFVDKYKYGFIDKSGDYIIDPQFGSASDFQKGMAWVQLNDKCGLIDYDGNTILDCQYDQYANFYEGFAWVKKDGKWGFINETGKEVLSPSYEDCYAFKEGLASVKKGEFWGYTNTEGQEVIKPAYKCAWAFNNGLAEVCKDGYQVFINKYGIETITLQEEYQSSAFHFHGNNYVWMIRNNKYGIKDIKGSSIIDCLYDNIVIIDSLKLFFVKILNKWQIMNGLGQEVIPKKYDYVSDFSEGRAWAKEGNVWSLINEYGREIMSLECENVWHFKNGHAWIIAKDSMSLVNKDGKKIPLEIAKNMQVLKPDQNEQNNKTVGRGLVYLNNWQIYPSGKPHEGFFQTVREKKWGYKSNSGNEIIPNFLDKYHFASEGKYMLYRGSKKGLLFADEQTYIPCEYDEIANIHSEWVLVMKNGKWGWVDHRGNVMIPCRYDAVTPFNDEGWATVLQFGLQFRINKKGEMIWR